jgi:hypothetical protein
MEKIFVKRISTGIIYQVFEIDEPVIRVFNNTTGEFVGGGFLRNEVEFLPTEKDLKNESYINSLENKMRYFQLINPIRNQYPLVGEKEIYIEENGVQTLILKRNIIANFPNETMEIAHDLSLEDVQREQSYLDLKNECELNSLENQSNEQ